MNYIAEFERLAVIVDEFDVNFKSNLLDIAFKDAISKVLENAEQNALDTLREGNLVIYREDGTTHKIAADKDTGAKRTEEETQEFFRIAYGSICCTYPFEIRVVRDFFTANGYKY